MANFNGRHGAAVVSLALGMFFATSHSLVAQDLTVAPAIRAAMASDAAIRPTLTQPAVVARPALLMPLYLSFAALQVLDITSTQHALAGGGVEANPMMGGVAGSPVAMTAVKLGAAAGIIVLSEKVRKRNPVAAVVMMVGMNSAYAMVVSHNYSVAR
jgi:ABC-type uncharacterized transport system permease subunit